MLIGCGETASRRLGEVYVYKAVPQDAVIGADRSRATYMLRGPGYPACENANRLFDLFNGYGHVPPRMLLEEARRLYEESRREFRLLQDRREQQSPKGRCLVDLSMRSHEVVRHLEAFFAAEDHQQSQEDERERVLIQAITRLMSTRRSLQRLEETLKDLGEMLGKESRDLSPPVLARLRGRLPLDLRLGGQPIPAEAVVTLPQPGPVWDEFCRSRNLSGDPVLVIDPERFTAFLAQALPALDQAPADQLGRSLQRDLLVVVQYLFSLRRGFDFGWPRVPRLERQGQDMQVVGLPTYDQSLEILSLRTRDAIATIGLILDSYRETMRGICIPHLDDKIEVEVLARSFDRLVPRHPNRPLSVPGHPDEPPTRLTVLLKTLFLRYLGDGGPAQPPEGRGTELLVTCEVQNAHDLSAGDSTVAPVVYERHYSPGHLVNLRDRIVYGPQLYRGEFLNFRLSVVSLSQLGSPALSQGLEMAVDAAGRFQPELTAISPFVTTLFRGLLSALSEDEIEMNFQFTFPGLEGKGKADVDLLLAETGHYILLKRENCTRGEFAQETASRRYSDADMIYNPEDGLLYHRKDAETPQNNFVPENLFRDQTYLVLVVTDEYCQEDNLGEALRGQLSRSLGEARARELIPDRSTTQNLLARLRNAPPPSPPPDNQQRARGIIDLRRRQDELWNPTSDFRKAMVLEGLYDQADPATRTRLGRDLEAWRRAELSLAEDGHITTR